MGIFRVPLIVAATKRRGGADANLALVADLGGDAAVGAFYCLDKNGALHSSVSHAGGFVTAITDYRGAAGYGPTLNVLGSAGGPVIDVPNRILTGTGVTNRGIGSALSAIFALNGVARTLVLLGAGRSGSAGWSYLAGVTDGVDHSRSIATRANNTVFYEVLHNGAIFGAGNGPAIGETRRLLLLSQDGATAGHRGAPTRARDDYVITAASAGTASLNLCGLLPSGDMDGHIRAALFLNRVPTAGDITILSAWAVSQGAVLY